MKTYRKKLKFSALVLSLLLIVPTAAVCTDAANVVSPALGVLAKDVVVNVTGMSSAPAKFSPEDFDFTIGQEVGSVTVLTLPDVSEGTLLLDGSPVAANQKIPRRNIGKLTFRPSAPTADTSFYVTVNDKYATECHVRVIESVNLSPAVTDDVAKLYIETMRGAVVRGSVTVTDPEGGALELVVTDMPKKGTVTVTDPAAGEFIYTPNEGKSGSDRFSMRACDEYGNWSDEIAVTVRINKNKSGIEYTDLAGHWAYNDAVKMTDAGIMGGAYVNGLAYFYPDTEVTREQFIALLMKTIGLSDIPEVTDAKFADDDKLGDDTRKYVRAAKKLGFVSGSVGEDGKLYFDPDSPISRAEVAVILQNVIKVKVTDAVPVFSDSDSIPSWALESVIAMKQIGVMSGTEDGKFSPSAPLCRADAASILSAVYDMVD